MEETEGEVDPLDSDEAITLFTLARDGHIV